MSVPPKRGPHEEAVQPSSSSMRPNFGIVEEEEPSVFARLSYGQMQDSRPGLLPRPDSRDGERRSPLHSLYRMPPAMTESPHSTHTVVGPEMRVESRESKESKGVETSGSRDVKVESREVHHQSGKAEKEGRIESRGDESKEVKHERDMRNDSRIELKVEKDVHGVIGSHPNWKDQHRVKRHPDVPSGGSGILGPWSGSQVRAKYEPPKELGVSNVMKERVEASEAVGENRVDPRADDKYKDRKRKEGKHHDWPENDKDRGDGRSNLQVGSSSGNEYKEATKEERESERWEREKKDMQKEKERMKEREKDHVDREAQNGGEKEGHHHEKEVAEKAPAQENLASEQKKPKEPDAWRNAEGKERRKERDGDVEGDRPEKRSRYYDKESDEGGPEVDGGTDRERDTFSYGVQQRKRMLRPRGSPQVGNRDGRFKTRGQDADGSQGELCIAVKPEVSTVYKVGECLQELTKLWKEYESCQPDKNSESLYNGPTLEVRIPAEHVTATNRQVRGGQLWGTDIYTDDSDLVAVLMHTGYCRPTASPPPAAIQELRATIRVLPPQDSYVSSLRNNVRSRAWGAAIGCSYRVECCCIVKKGGGTIDLEPCLTHTSTIEPTLAPVAVERTMTTRAAASNALRQQRFVREVTIQYNLCNEPWIKYSISIVADKGLKKPLYTSARLKKGEVLYLETHSCRYELCFASEKIVKAASASQGHEADAEKSQNHVHAANGERITAEGDNVVVDMFRWSRCKKPLPQKVMRSIGIPLPLEHVEVLEENLDWEDVQWSQTGVWIAGKEYQLARVHFLSPN